MTKILYVEDNEDNIYMLKSRLERRDFSVVVATDGEQAVEMAEAEEPSLIIMDLSLPNVDGWEATRRLKANDRTKHIPVIALSAHAMVGDRETALNAGCDDYDTKPVEFQRLPIEAIRRWPLPWSACSAILHSCASGSREDSSERSAGSRCSRSASTPIR